MGLLTSSASVLSSMVHGTGTSVPCPILSVDVEMSIPICEKGEFEDNGNECIERPLTYSNKVIKKRLPCAPPTKDSGICNT